MSRAPKTNKTKKPSAPSKEGESENICFTIMPFGGWFDNYYDNIYRPAIEAAGLVPRRADDLYAPSTIVHDIWTLTKTAKIVLAELTGKNPNVFYELGLAHAIARPAILVTQTLEDVPFDLRALRVIVYDRNRPDWGEVLRKGIEASIREVLASPTKSVLPSFLQIDDSRKLTVTTTEKELISLRQDVDLLKRVGLRPAVGKSTMLIDNLTEPWLNLNTATKEAWATLFNSISEKASDIQPPSDLKNQTEDQQPFTDG